MPLKLRGFEVCLLDMTAMVAGTQFRGQFENRMKGLIEEVKKLGFDGMIITASHTGKNNLAEYGFDGWQAYNWGTGGYS